MSESRYCSYAVLDIENWSARRAVEQHAVTSQFATLVARALQDAAIPSDLVRYQHTGDGMIIALSSTVPKERICTRFVEALRTRVADHDATTPDDQFRVRLALHAGPRRDLRLRAVTVASALTMS